MVKLLVLVALSLGCDLVDRVVDADGTVYDCGDVEYCYLADAADELSELTGLSCSPATVSDRWWPGLTNALGRGCRYVCPGRVGCNARGGGCFCPPVPITPSSNMLSGAVLELLHVDGDGECEASWIQPAIHCGGMRILDFDGCHWHCVSILDLPKGPRQ